MRKDYKVENFGIDQSMCPHCGSEDTYLYDTDECEFSHDGTGHVRTDNRCNGCQKSFRLTPEFNYQVTAQWAR